MARAAGGIARWLLPATVLHAAVGLVALALSRGAEPPKALVTHEQVIAPAEEILELTLRVDGARAPAFADRSSASAPEPKRATPAVAHAAISNIETLEAPTLGRDGSSSLSPPTSSASAKPPEPEPEAAATLSLDRLGIGQNPFATGGWAMLAAPVPLSEAAQANQRLQASLHQQWTDSDRQRGLGPEGPIVDAARRLLVADDDLSETSAVLNIHVDGRDRVTDVQVLQASSQAREWQMIAARLAKHLGPMTLRGAGSNPGWGVKLRLASALKLPSGLSPGLRTDILGLTLPGSAGPGAASLSLTPTSPLPMPEPIDRIGRQVDKVMPVELGLLKLNADVADIGGSPQRVVQVAVLSLDEAAAP